MTLYTPTDQMCKYDVTGAYTCQPVSAPPPKYSPWQDKDIMYNVSGSSSSSSSSTPSQNKNVPVRSYPGYMLLDTPTAPLKESFMTRSSQHVRTTQGNWPREPGGGF